MVLYHVSRIAFRIFGKEFCCSGCVAVFVSDFFNKMHGREGIEEARKGFFIERGLTGQLLRSEGLFVQHGEKIQFYTGVQGAGLPVATGYFHQLSRVPFLFFHVNLLSIINNLVKTKI